MLTFISSIVIGCNIIKYFNLLSNLIALRFLERPAFFILNKKELESSFSLW